MAASEFNEDTEDQICDLLDNLQRIKKLKNKDIRILLYKVVRKYGGKVINKTLINPTINFYYFTKCCSLLPFVLKE